VDYCLEEIEKTKGLKIRTDMRKVLMLKQACELVKAELSVTTADELCVPGLIKGDDWEFTITREDFERKVEYLIDQTLLPIDKVLERGKVRKEDITDVLLAGGSSWIPKVGEKLQEFFQKRLFAPVDPPFAGVLGAAYIARDLLESGDWSETPCALVTSPAAVADPRKSASKALEQLVIRLVDFPRIRNLGRGSFGEVYCARDARNGETVAVKVMQNDLSKERDRELFLREVVVLAGIDHETLLGFRGWALPTENDPPAIVTEFMTQGSLQSMIDAEKDKKAPAKWDETRKFIALYGIAIGMMTLHKARIIHRDLKPDNVLLNDNFEPKVADFGLSKVVDSGATFHQTMHGGTPLYVAPEIWEGSDYSFPVDVYAFGMLLYVCITLVDPLHNIKSGIEFPRRICAGRRPKIPKQVGKGWKGLIEECWAQAPDSRPTFEEIAMRMKGTDFVGPGIDQAAVLAYQKRTVPPAFHLKTSRVESSGLEDWVEFVVRGGGLE
jgi:hypothetical protein